MNINLSIGLAFLAGLASFLSPCVFSLVPAFIGYLGGRSVLQSETDSRRQIQWQTFLHGLAFVLGFSAVFVSLGLAFSSLGQFLYRITPILAKLGGVIIILFGLHMTDLLNIPFLNYDFRPRSKTDRQRGFISSFLMGVFFFGRLVALCWTHLGSDLDHGFEQRFHDSGQLIIGVVFAWHGNSLPGGCPGYRMGDNDIKKVQQGSALCRYCNGYHFDHCGCVALLGSLPETG